MSISSYTPTIVPTNTSTTIPTTTTTTTTPPPTSTTRARDNNSEAYVSSRARVLTTPKAQGHLLEGKTEVLVRRSQLNPIS